ncbi:MAG TPA: Os1348 family NHLP clan protein [Thermoanaerobaculia bacterium]|nr:Os1348 family NHLP clan protein [Thermoanaerobaculia bacterium]
MSQCHVERVIGRLVTDEGFRRRFAADPAAALEELAAAGVELNPCERHALLGLDSALVRWFADRLDPRIQKCDLHRPPG